MKRKIVFVLLWLAQNSSLTVKLPFLSLQVQSLTCFKLIQKLPFLYSFVHSLFVNEHLLSSYLILDFELLHWRLKHNSWLLHLVICQFREDIVSYKRSNKFYLAAYNLAFLGQFLVSHRNRMSVVFSNQWLLKMLHM